MSDKKESIFSYWKGGRYDHLFDLNPSKNKDENINNNDYKNINKEKKDLESIILPRSLKSISKVCNSLQ